jgi:hypothetical protein
MGEVQLAESLLTPGDMIGAIDTINRAVDALNGDVRAHARLLLCGSGAAPTGPCMPLADGKRFYNDWIAFYAEWTSFYADHNRGSSFFTRLGPAEYISTSLAATIREKGNAYNAFEQRYRTLTGLPPTATTHEYVSWSERFSRLGQTGMIWVGLGILGVGTVGYLLSQYAKVRMVSKLALNRPRRRRRRR